MTTFDWATLRTRAHPGASNDQRRAVVIGASLAGLLVARVLSEHFDEVMLLERDELPSGNAHRKATPRVQHAHGLLARGCQALETLFPGIHGEWLAAGRCASDLQQSVPFFAGRLRFASGHAGVQGMAVGRVVIEPISLSYPVPNAASPRFGLGAQASIRWTM